jgi:hypothetical protein
MTFAIPKQLKQLNSLMTPTVLDVDMNDTDIDRMITKILEMAVKRGRGSGSRVNTRDYVGFLTRLHSSAYLRGFDGDRGRDVLDGWVRSSVLKEERAGRRRDTVQMGYLRPLTIAAYRSGLPKSTSRNRRADSLTYRTMARILAGNGSTNPSAEIQQLFVATFGRGVELGPFPSTSPRYDGETKVDIDTLLALRFIEEFEGNENLTREREPLDPPIPQASDKLGSDLITFLRLYGPLMPVSEAYSHVSVLLSLRLFQLPLISAYSVRAMLAGDEPLPSGWNPCSLYCDFVRIRGGASDELSRMSVARDLEVLRTFFGDRLLFRSLHDAMSVLPERAELGQSAEARLYSLAKLRDTAAMQMALQMQISSIHAALEESSEGRAFIDEVRAASSLAAADQLSAILVEGLRKRGLENQVKWFWSTGGILKPYGILAGTLRARSTWRYAPGDECLTTLLCMCFADADGERTSRRLPIRAVLERLETRFGILIDKPSAELDSADARAGAAANLSAFTQRLKLLGCFQGLSDDFTAQFVTRPREALK